MSDAEQGQMATLLADVPTSPLQDAATRRQQSEQTEYQAQLLYQAKRKEVDTTKAQRTLLALQESRAQSRESVQVVREQARTLEPALHTLDADLRALDEARKTANAAMFRAQHGYLALADAASAAYRTMRRGLRHAADADLSPVEAMDAEALAEQAFRDLCGLIGQTEADRLRPATERPARLQG